MSLKKYKNVNRNQEKAENIFEYYQKLKNKCKLCWIKVNCLNADF